MDEAPWEPGTKIEVVGNQKRWKKCCEGMLGTVLEQLPNKQVRIMLDTGHTEVVGNHNLKWEYWGNVNRRDKPERETYVAARLKEKAKRRRQKKKDIQAEDDEDKEEEEEEEEDEIGEKIFKKKFKFATDKPIGICFDKARISKVVEGSQADEMGVREGWVVRTVNAKPMPNNKEVIRQAIRRAKEAGPFLAIVFLKMENFFSKYINAEDGTNLRLEDKEIDDRACITLVNIMRNYHQLRALNLAHNNITEIGAERLGNALNESQGLTYLNLRKNECEDRGAVAIANSLKTNTLLTKLDLSWNQIGDVGAIRLAEALWTNNILTSLKIYDNAVTDTGADAYLEAAKHNSTLTSLLLNLNPISYEKIEELRAIRSSHVSLKEIMF